MTRVERGSHSSHHRRSPAALHAIYSRECRRGCRQGCRRGCRRATGAAAKLVSDLPYGSKMQREDHRRAAASTCASSGSERCARGMQQLSMRALRNHLYRTAGSASARFGRLPPPPPPSIALVATTQFGILVNDQREHPSSSPPVYVSACVRACVGRPLSQLV